MRGLVVLLLALGAVSADDFDDVRDMVMNKMKEAAKIAVSMKKADDIEDLMMSKTHEEDDHDTEDRVVGVSAEGSVGPLSVGGAVDGSLSGVDAGVEASLGGLEGGASVGAGLTQGLQGEAHLGPLAANANLGLQGAGAGVNLGPLGLGASAGFNNQGFNFGGGLGWGNYAAVGTPQYFHSTYGPRPWYHPLSILGVRRLVPPPTNHDNRFSLPSLNFNLGANVGSFSSGANAGFDLQDGVHAGAHLGNLATANANLGLTSAGVGANVGQYGSGLHAGLTSGLTSGLGFMGGLGHGNYAAYGTPEYLTQQYGPGLFGRSRVPVHPLYGPLPLAIPHYPTL